MLEIKEYLDHLLETSTPERPAWNKEALLEHHKPGWNYIDSCMIKAILEMYEITGKQEYLDFADGFIDYYVDEDGGILNFLPGDYNCDNINGGKVLIPLYEKTGKEKYRKAFYRLYQQLQTHPRTKSGNFWHKKIYPDQIWLDGLYMVQPFYMEYEMKYNGKKYYKDIFEQFTTVYHRMRDLKTGLYYHGYDEARKQSWADPETGRSRHFWTRSLGWFAMALTDTLEKMDHQFFYEYEELTRYLKEVSDALLAAADKTTKMFWQVTDQGGRPGNYLETSGTCAIAYSLMKGARLALLPEYYYRYGEEIFKSVASSKLQTENGAYVLKDICLVAGLGGMPGKGAYKERDGSYAYYISEPVVNDDAKGVAPFLFAFTEYFRTSREGE